MKIMQDAQAVEALAAQYALRDCFDTQELRFLGFQYQKGELLCSPLNPEEYLLFLVQGSVELYDLNDAGDKLPVGSLTGPALLGDLEFISEQPTDYFVEAREDCVCLALSGERYREELDRDVRFLHCLLESVAGKFALTGPDTVNLATEERLLQLIRAEGELTSLEPVAGRIRCSRRQLQRILKKLCDEGRLLRLGKGRYRLPEDAEDV
ncbi:MAG: cyclic nucleotide-binding domain-containing protein [Oscillospiraceae bacterium]|nr:cyclic nucleotide-binding domain-containing protein [Oscillospiraceae bacterium]